MNRSLAVIGAMSALAGDPDDDAFARSYQDGTALGEAIQLLDDKEDDLLNDVEMSTTGYRIVHHAKLYLMDEKDGY